MKKPTFKAEVTLSKEEVELALKQYVTANMIGGEFVDAESVQLNLDIDDGDTPAFPRPLFRNAVVTVKPRLFRL